jgi:hypothetical protein
MAETMSNGGDNQQMALGLATMARKVERERL